MVPRLRCWHRVAHYSPLQTAVNRSLTTLAPLTHSLSFPALRAPHPPGDLTHESQLGLLVSGRERVASRDGSKAALRTERQPLQGHVLARLLDARLNGRGLLQYGALRGQQPEHYRMLRQDVPQGV